MLHHGRSCKQNKKRRSSIDGWRRQKQKLVMIFLPSPHPFSPAHQPQLACFACSAACRPACTVTPFPNALLHISCQPSPHSLSLSIPNSSTHRLACFSHPPTNLILPRCLPTKSPPPLASRWAGRGSSFNRPSISFPCLSVPAHSRHRCFGRAGTTTFPLTRPSSQALQPRQQQFGRGSKYPHLLPGPKGVVACTFIMPKPTRHSVLLRMRSGRQAPRHATTFAVRFAARSLRPLA